MQSLPDEEFIKLKNSMMNLFIPYLDNNDHPKAR
jgi:hypothetical protein